MPLTARVSGASHNRGRSKQNYATPAVFIEAVKARWRIREFALDLAADAENAKADEWIDEAADSLSAPWDQLLGRGWGWLNPPFDNIAPCPGRTAGRRALRAVGAGVRGV